MMLYTRKQMEREIDRRMHEESMWREVWERLDRQQKQIEELSKQRDRAYARLCEWCGVCPEGKRNAEDCEIAAIYPEPPKEEA